MDESVAMPSNAPVLRVVPMPADANFHGDIFGGWIMSHVDVAGAIPASQRACGRVATVAVNSFTFKQPVFVGDVVSVLCRDHEGWPHVDHRRRRGVCAAQSRQGNYGEGHRGKPHVRRGRSGP